MNAFCVHVEFHTHDNQGYNVEEASRKERPKKGIQSLI